jgi:putative transposase
VKYAFVETHQDEFRIVTMCRVLDATRSGFYAWRYRQTHPSIRQQRRAHRDGVVKQAFVTRKCR